MFQVTYPYSKTLIAITLTTPTPLFIAFNRLFAIAHSEAWGAFHVNATELH